MKKNHLGCSSVLRCLNVEQKCIVLCLADVECLSVTEAVFCTSISCVFCVHRALSKRLLDSSTVCSFVRFPLHLFSWMYRLSLVFILHLSLGHVILSGFICPYLWQMLMCALNLDCPWLFLY